MLCVYNHTIYVADVMSVTFSGSVRDDFAGSEDAPHDWSVQLVLPLAHVSRVVGNAQNKNWERSLLVEILFGESDRQHSGEPVLPVRSFVAVLAHIPGEDTDLIVVKGQAIVRIGQHA